MQECRSSVAIGLLTKNKTQNLSDYRKQMGGDRNTRCLDWKLLEAAWVRSGEKRGSPVVGARRKAVN